MKKLNLEMLRLSTNEILERSQMKKITGGYGIYVYCHCTGSPGAWGATYNSWDEIRAAVEYWCASGAGYCN
jgi:natural product precursor